MLKEKYNSTACPNVIFVIVKPSSDGYSPIDSEDERDSVSRNISHQQYLITNIAHLDGRNLVIFALRLGVRGFLYLMSFSKV